MLALGNGRLLSRRGLRDVQVVHKEVRAERRQQDERHPEKGRILHEGLAGRHAGRLALATFGGLPSLRVAAKERTQQALVFQAIEGSDEAPLDGNSSLVRVSSGETEEFRVSPDSVGLSRATRADIPWKSAEDETSRSLAALEGEAGPVRDLILYNAALRLWTAANEGTPLAGWVERAREALSSGAALRLLDRLRQPVPVGG